MQDLANLGLSPATAAAAKTPRLASGVAELDAFLAGGLPTGALTEWGVPLGLGGRYVVLAFLAAATQRRLPVLWVYAATPLFVFPPSWAALGVDLGWLSFVRTDAPVRDLKPALLDPFYRLIVLDMPPRLGKDDLAFLAGQARAHQATVLILRSRWLAADRGNVWARLRLNARRDPARPKHFTVEVIRGLSPRCCSVLLPFAAAQR